MRIMPKIIDSHCHLDSEQFAEDVDDVVARARAAGVDGMLAIATKLTTFAPVLAIAEKHHLWCSVGVHPEYALTDPLSGAGEIEALCAHPRVVGIGETGLDYFYSPETAEDQIRNFRYHIAASQKTGLPLIVHTRNADTATTEILRTEMAAGAFTGVLHCFSSGRALAEAALELGFYISVSGIATFKKADALVEILRDVPLDRLLVETDAPYLAPVPKRGVRNEPAFVVHTAAKLAEIKGVSPETLAQATNDNFFRLFRKAVA